MGSDTGRAAGHVGPEAMLSENGQPYVCPHCQSCLFLAKEFRCGNCSARVSGDGLRFGPGPQVQEVLDRSRWKMADEIIDALKITTVERALEVAKAWCTSTAQEAANAAHYKRRAEAAEAKLATKGLHPPRLLASGEYEINGD